MLNPFLSFRSLFRIILLYLMVRLFRKRHSTIKQNILKRTTLGFIVFNGFTKYGGSSSKWCSTHRLNFKALSRAVSIRAQLKKYLSRFGAQGGKIESCEGDHQRLRRCLGLLVSFFFLWKDVAEFLVRWDGFQSPDISKTRLDGSKAKGLTGV